MAKEQQTEKEVVKQNPDGLSTEYEEQLFNEEFFEYETEEEGVVFKLWSLIFEKKKIEKQEGFKEGEMTIAKVYIYDELLEAKHYVKLIELLRTVPFNLVIFYINSTGGDIFTLLTLCGVLEDLRGKQKLIVTVNDGQCSSAAAILLCAGDEICFSKFSDTMFHNMSVSFVGRESSSLAKSISIYTKQYEELLKTYASKLLSSNEINDIIQKGAEIHILEKEAKKRLKKWDHKVAKKMKAEEEKELKKNSYHEAEEEKEEKKDDPIHYSSPEMKERLEYYASLEKEK